MKKLFKKNQLIITAMAALIAVAGYLNYTEKNVNDKNTESTENMANANAAAISDSGEQQTTTGAANVAEAGSAEGENVENTGAQTEGTPGEAIFVNATGTVDFIVEAKMSKEYARASAQESLQLVLDNTALSSDEKQAAVDKMVELAEVSEREVAAENLIMAIGYSDVAVTMTDGYVDVIIVAEELDDTNRAKIEDIVKRKMQVEANKITINAIEVN